MHDSAEILNRVVLLCKSSCLILASSLLTWVAIMSYNTQSQIKQFFTIQEPCESFQSDWDQLLNDFSINQAYDFSFIQPTGYEFFEQSVQPSNCAPLFQPIENEQCEDSVMLSDFLADSSSMKMWWLNQFVTSKCTTMTSVNSWSQMNLQSDSKKPIKIVITLQELKQAVKHSKRSFSNFRTSKSWSFIPSLTCSWRYSVSKKAQGNQCLSSLYDMNLADRDRNLLQLNDYLKNFVFWTVKFRKVANNIVNKTLNRVKLIESKQKDSEMIR